MVLLLIFQLFGELFLVVLELLVHGGKRLIPSFEEPGLLLQALEIPSELLPLAIIPEPANLLPEPLIVIPQNLGVPPGLKIDPFEAKPKFLEPVPLLLESSNFLVLLVQHVGHLGELVDQEFDLLALGFELLQVVLFAFYEVWRVQTRHRRV